MSDAIEVIRERWSKATRGPWRWFGDTAGHGVCLATVVWVLGIRRIQT
jgi:hypothetical protein